MVKNLKLLRTERGVSQQKLADAVGMSQPSINDYENRETEPDISTLTKIADFFETSVDFLIGHTHIRHKIVDGDEYILNADEATLINGYRLLSASSQKAISLIITEIVNK